MATTHSAHFGSRRRSRGAFKYFGVGGQSVIGHIHTVRLQIHGFSEWIEIEVAFIDARLPYQLLGQTGFFDNYEINFKRYRGRFEIKSRSFLHRE